MFRGIVIEGNRYFLDLEQRTYVCDTTFEYYLLYAPSPSAKKTKKNKNEDKENEN
jgi:hypothetical protein